MSDAKKNVGRIIAAAGIIGAVHGATNIPKPLTQQEADRKKVELQQGTKGRKDGRNNPGTSGR